MIAMVGVSVSHRKLAGRNVSSRKGLYRVARRFGYARGAGLVNMVPGAVYNECQYFLHRGVPGVHGHVLSN